MAPPRTRTVPTGFVQPPTKRARRLLTTGARFDVHQRRPPVAFNALRKKVFDQVTARLMDAKVVIHGVDVEALNWMLPTDDAEPGIWEYFLEFPWLVPDTVLQPMLNLEESTVKTSNPPSGTTLFYVRSFEIPCDKLLQVFTVLEQGDVRVASAKVANWRKGFDLLTDPSHSVFLRYVGMSDSVAAYSRFAADLKCRTDGFYGAFMSALGEVAPEVIVGCKVYSFPDATTRALPGKDGTLRNLHISHIDIREQALIELFDRRTLLNQRTGGKYNTYQPSDEDVAMFQSLQTSAFDKIEKMMKIGRYSAPDDQIQDHVANHVRSICNLGEAYPEELGTDSLPVSGEMKLAWAKQSTHASCYDGNVLFLLVGDYLPLSSMYNPAPYWKQTETRSVNLMKDTLSRLRAAEKQDKTWDHSGINNFANAALLPFVNFQYTPKRNSRHAESAGILRKYMESAKPLIVMTFERRTTGVVGDNFVGTYSDKRLTPVVGIPRLRYWTDPGNVSGRGNRGKTAEFNPDPNDCFIQIPSFHPGSQAYEEVDSLRRVFEMTQWQLLLAFDVALDLLEKGWCEGFLDTRQELCKTIMKEMQSRWDACGCAEALETAKQCLQTGHFATKKGRYSSDPNRAARSTLNGQEVPVNGQGVVSMYWTLPDKSKVLVKICGGTKSDVHAPKSATGRDKIRTVHFLPTGIDIRDVDGKSATYTKSNHKHTNPTFPGAVLRGKIEARENGTERLKDLWEAETGLDFEQTFPRGLLKAMGFNDPKVTKIHHQAPSRTKN